MKLSEINPNELNNELIKKIFFSIDKDEYEHADYIIVYGCHIKPLLDERLAHVLSIIKDKEYNKIVLTGGVGVNGDFNESEYMYNYLIEHGVDKDRIIIENKSTTTEENNINVLNMLDLNSIQNKTNIVIVTQELHMMRIMLHWGRIISNPNIKFYYDYVDNSIVSYENVINNPDILMILQKQVEKTIKFIKEGEYIDIDINQISQNKNK